MILEIHHSSTFEQHANFLRSFVQKGGPEPEDYCDFTFWIEMVSAAIESGRITTEQISTLLDSFGDVFDTATMQGFARRKPHGYAGDYEIIDRIYRTQVAHDPQLVNWDRYFHAQKAPIAVRNRKEYFLRLAATLEQAHTGPEFRILNLASGPARDLYEYLSTHSDRRSVFDCVELDADAIKFASTLCSEYLHRITFQCANVLRFQTSQKYDLIWSAGLFDYLSDKAFKMLIVRFYNYLNKGGEMVIGNFSILNPTKHYMDLMGWKLIHRSKDELVDIAISCGIGSKSITVDREPAGVNLFLRVTK
jgi:extracellular factor (EF) 3-hydroxypalmitic acid methyl ester biosynthesis protein